jgi:hypothetical protein
MAIRWGKGAFRAWVILSIVWVGVVAWINYGPRPLGPYSDWQVLEARSKADCEAAAEAAAKIVVPGAPPLDTAECMHAVSIRNWQDAERFAWTVLPPSVY